jgi:hypothetical protein
MAPMMCVSGVTVAEAPRDVRALPEVDAVSVESKAVAGLYRRLAISVCDCAETRAA